MKKQRIYLDTSVFGGYFDEEFEEFTRPLFSRIDNGEFTVLLSAVLQKELEPAPKNIIKLITNFKRDFTEFLEEDDDEVELATTYISERVEGETSFVDCLHIALATVNQADILVSWNFKHIVNVERIRGYNYVNLKNGYRQLDIRSPRELMKYGN